MNVHAATPTGLLGGIVPDMTTPTEAPPVPTIQFTRHTTTCQNIRAEIARAGFKQHQLEPALTELLGKPFSHGAVMRRFSVGTDTEWSITEVEAIAVWLDVPFEVLTATR